MTKAKEIDIVTCLSINDPCNMNLWIKKFEIKNIVSNSFKPLYAIPFCLSSDLNN